MRLSNRVASLLAAGAVGMIGFSSAANAQAVSFNTTGFFSPNTAPYCTPTGTMGSPGAAMAECSSAGTMYATQYPFDLVFQGSTFNNQAATPGLGNINFGTFLLTTTGPTGSLTVPPSWNAYFTLVVNQTNPTTGSDSPTGMLSGTITASATQGNGSSLIFTPTPSHFSIDGVNYAFNFDNTGPAAGVGYVIPVNPSSATSLGGSVVATPEPASIALLATGLFGMIPMVKMRRRKNTEV